MCKAPLAPRVSRARRAIKAPLGQMANPDLKAPRAILEPRARRAPKVTLGMQARRGHVGLRA